jgi:adenosylcobinamide amidohydrolase
VKPPRNVAGEFVRQFNLVGNHVRLVLKDNVLAVLADADLNLVSTAIYNGGFKKTRAILNVQVPEEYSDQKLHEDPADFIRESSKKLGVAGDFVGMITAAKIENYSLITETNGDLRVNVVVTAGCSHA